MQSMSKTFVVCFAKGKRPTATTSHKSLRAMMAIATAFAPNQPQADIPVLCTSIFSACHQERSYMFEALTRECKRDQELQYALKLAEDRLRLARGSDTPGPLIRGLKKTVRGLNFKIDKNEKTRRYLEQSIAALDRKMRNLEHNQRNHGHRGGSSQKIYSPSFAEAHRSEPGITIDPDIANAFQSLTISSNPSTAQQMSHVSPQMAYFSPMAPYTPIILPQILSPVSAISSIGWNGGSPAPWASFDQSLTPSEYQFSPQLSPLTQWPCVWYPVTPPDAVMQVSEQDEEAVATSTEGGKLDNDNMSVDAQEDQMQEQGPARQTGASFTLRLSSMGNTSSAMRLSRRSQRQQHSF